MASKGKMPTIAQGPKGGKYIVGSERTVGGKKKKTYISEEQYRRMTTSNEDTDNKGAVKEQQGVSETKTTAKNEAGIKKQAKDKQTGPAKTKADKISTKKESKIDQKTGLFVAGKKPKTRNNRLPEAGTKMVTTDKVRSPISATEDKETGVITIFDKDNKPVAMGNTLTAAVSALYGKAMPAYSMFGLKTDAQKEKNQVSTETRAKKQKEREEEKRVKTDELKQVKELKKKESDEKKVNEKKEKAKKKTPKKKKSEADRTFDFGKMKLRQKVKNWFRQEANTIKKVHSATAEQFQVSVGNRQYMIKQKLGVGNKPTGPIWGKEKGTDKKPFKVTEKWVKDQQSRKSIKKDKEEKVTKEPTTVVGERKLSNPDTVKKALELVSQIDTPDDARLDIHSDGVIIRSGIGRVQGFIPFAEPLMGSADDIIKSLPDDVLDHIRVEFTKANRAGLDDDQWTNNDNGTYSRQSEVWRAPSMDSMVKSFHYDRDGMVFVGYDSVDRMCKVNESNH